jgi:hypothetical protein
MCHQIQVRLTLCIVAIAMKYHHKYNEQPWQLRRNFVAIATKSFDKSKTYDVDVVCATKNHGNLRRISMEIATTWIHQDQSYDEDVVCVMKNCGNLRRKFVAISTVVKMQFFVFDELSSILRRYH